MVFGAFSSSLTLFFFCLRYFYIFSLLLQKLYRLNPTKDFKPINNIKSLNDYFYSELVETKWNCEWKKAKRKQLGLDFRKKNLFKDVKELQQIVLCLHRQNIFLAWSSAVGILSYQLNNSSPQPSTEVHLFNLLRYDLLKAINPQLSIMIL